MSGHSMVQVGPERVKSTGAWQWIYRSEKCPTIGASVIDWGASWVDGGLNGFRYEVAYIVFESATSERFCLNHDDHDYPRSFNDGLDDELALLERHASADPPTYEDAKVDWGVRLKATLRMLQEERARLIEEATR